jgi:hypothetical protein
LKNQSKIVYCFIKIHKYGLKVNEEDTFLSIFMGAADGFGFQQVYACRRGGKNTGP